MYTEKEVLEFVRDSDVRFIRLAFADVYGNPKNISILPEELPRAFAEGISFDASAIHGFGSEIKSDLFLHPDSATLTVLPWRPSRGRVIRLFADIRHPDGSDFACDTRQILRATARKAMERGFAVNIGTEFEFYLFKLDENSQPTKNPLDEAGYMDIFPEDRGENIRREICLTLSEMGFRPESSHHEEGPGQNEIDFRFSGALPAADNAITFRTVVKTVAMQSGLWADFSPKPLGGKAGNGMHVNLSLASGTAADTDAFMAGMMEHICEITAFLNPLPASYLRLGENKAPRYVTWSPENRSQLIRIPAASSAEYRRIELRSPDPSANPYLAFALLIEAGLDGIERGLTPPPPTNVNLYTAGKSITDALTRLPATPEEAQRAASRSSFIRTLLPKDLCTAYHLTAD